MDMILQQYISTQEAANRLKVSRSRIRHLLAQGRLQGVKMDGGERDMWLVLASSLDDYAPKRKPYNPYGRSGKPSTLVSLPE